jgi:hypothetical protein
MTSAGTDETLTELGNAFASASDNGLSNFLSTWKQFFSCTVPGVFSVRILKFARSCVTSVTVLHGAFIVSPDIGAVWAGGRGLYVRKNSKKLGGGTFEKKFRKREPLYPCRLRAGGFF